jgi:hypothetical protein
MSGTVDVEEFRDMLGLEEQEISLIGTNPEVHRAASWCV